MPDKNCFIIMPITTPADRLQDYGDDEDHFEHVLEHLFIPSVKKAGFNPISPKTSGSEIIQAEIIKNLSDSDLVLCDMSILNPNVFFEFGIRTALDKPVSLVVDDKIKSKIPFDTSIIQYHKYDSSLKHWEMEKEIKELTKHIKKAYQNNANKNALWKYFGVSQFGSFKPEDATSLDRTELILRKLESLTFKEHEIENLKTSVWALQADLKRVTDDRNELRKAYLKAL